MSSIPYQIRLARRSLRRLAVTLRNSRHDLNSQPVFFANSFPKSGTHLLTQVLQGFQRLGSVVDAGLPAVVTFQGDTGRQRHVDEILRDLKRFKPGDIAYGHLHASPEVVSFLTADGYAAYFILRDPRDVVVSHVHYITDMEPTHIHHRYYTTELHSFDERLRTSILGLPDPSVPFPDIRQRFEPYLGWLGLPQVLVMRFEEFLEDRRQALGKIFDHAIKRGYRSNLERNKSIPLLEECIDPQRSPTFRSGKAGGWVKEFSPENKRLFKEITGDLLFQLGYETDAEW